MLGYALDSHGRADHARSRPITIPPGTTSVSIGQDGIVNYIDSTGTSKPLAQITLAKFPNDDGLQRGSGNMFSSSPTTRARRAGRSRATRTAWARSPPGALEMSNVDLAAEFTNMIRPSAASRRTAA